MKEKERRELYVCVCLSGNGRWGRRSCLQLRVKSRESEEHDRLTAHPTNYSAHQLFLFSLQIAS